MKSVHSNASAKQTSAFYIDYFENFRIVIYTYYGTLFRIQQLQSGREHAHRRSDIS